MPAPGQKEENLPLRLRHMAEEEAAELPALIAAAEHALSSILHGEHVQRKPGSGERFWQFREYVPGDRPQDIDWRQSAKTDSVYIRQKEWQTTQTSIFWCNQGASMDFSSDKAFPTKAYSAKILTLALSILMTRGHEQIGLYGAARTGRSGAMVDHIGNALCDERREHKDLPDFTGKKLPRNCALIQIGDFLQPFGEIESVFKKLSHQTGNGLVVQVLDRAELELPYQGRALFEDLSGGRQELVNHVSSIREEYKNRIEEHIERLQSLCKQCHWSYILHRTDTDIADTLADIWNHMCPLSPTGRGLR